MPKRIYAMTNGGNGHRVSPSLRVPSYRGRYARYGGARKAVYRYAPKTRSGELKFFDTAFSSTIAATGTILDSLNLIAQGTTENSLNGRKCTLRSIKIQGAITAANSTLPASTSVRCRVIFYVDKQTNGATAAVLDLLETAVINSHKNLANQGRFIILSDTITPMNLYAGSGDGTTNTFGEVQTIYDVYRKLNTPLEFSGTDGTIGTIRSNNIGMLAITDTAAPVVNLAYTARVRFSDL